MATHNKNNNKCRAMRHMLGTMAAGQLSIRARWIQEHIAKCPRCQRRLSGYSRAALALSLIKSQSHELDLLSRANARAISVLRRDIREVPKAEKLRQVQPEPNWFQRCRRYTHSLGHAAACAAILLLMRMGIFSSMETFQAKGEEAVRRYYAHRLGDEIADDLFAS